MFKRNAHQFTCPDVIYLRARQKRSAIIQLVIVGVGTLGLWVTGAVMEYKDKRDLKNENVPTV